MSEVMIKAERLTKYFGPLAAVDRASFEIARGEVVAFLGPNGAGKSTTMRILTGFIAPTHGRAEIAGIDVATRRVEAAALIGYLPENGPLYADMTPLALLKFFGSARGLDADRLARRIDRVIELCALPGVVERPISKLSKGYRQRVGMAQTLLHVKEELDVSMIMIGHDMGLQAQLVDRIAVMYAGNMMEIAPVKAAYADPLHPYTQLLIDSIPSIKERKPLKVTEGLTHDLRDLPPGCVFHLRCPHVMDRCREEVPVLRELAPKHHVACHLH